MSVPDSGGSAGSLLATVVPVTAAMVLVVKMKILLLILLRLLRNWMELGTWLLQMIF